MASRHPIIVGIGQITYHPEEHPDYLHPLQLAKIAVESAVEDCRGPAVLGHADMVTVINMFSHGYADPAGLFCEMLGFSRASASTRPSAATRPSGW